MCFQCWIASQVFQQALGSRRRPDTASGQWCATRRQDQHAQFQSLQVPVGHKTHQKALTKRIPFPTNWAFNHPFSLQIITYVLHRSQALLDPKSLTLDIVWPCRLISLDLSWSILIHLYLDMRDIAWHSSPFWFWSSVLWLSCHWFGSLGKEVEASYSHDMLQHFYVLRVGLYGPGLSDLFMPEKGWTSGRNFPDAKSAFEGGWHGWDRVGRKRHTRSTMKGPINSWFGWTGAIVNEELFDRSRFWSLLNTPYFCYIHFILCSFCKIGYLWERSPAVVGIDIAFVLYLICVGFFGHLSRGLCMFQRNI